jgi:hypothetical protein
MAISRIVPNIKSDRPAATRDFFVDLGFEVVTDLGWVMTLASPTNSSAQVTIIGNDDMAAPGLSVDVPDVDAVRATIVERASRSRTRCAMKTGESDASCFASRAARSVAQSGSPVAPRTGAPSSTGSITLRSRRRSARLMPRRAGPTHRSPQSVLSGPERLGGGAFPGRILVSGHRDHRGEGDQRP